MTVTVEKIVEEIKTLSPQQRQRLRDMLDESPEEELHRRKEEVYQRLRDKGIIVHIPLPDVEHLPFEDYVPVTVEGKPLSETIIEERR